LIDGVSGAIQSYAQVRDWTLRGAHRLRAKGYDVGARAAVLSHNDASAYGTVLSIMRAGLTWLPVNPRNTAADNAAALNGFRCDVLFYHSDLSHDVETIKAAVPSLRELVCIDRDDGGAPSLARWLGDTKAAPFETQPDPERLFALLPTGGTTGQPKGVMMPNRSLENIVANLSAVAPPRGRPVFLAAAPLTHAAGMVGQYVLAHGGALVTLPKADPQGILEAIPRFSVTHTFLPPTVIYGLLAQKNVRAGDYSSMQYLMYGASPMSPDKIKLAVEVFGPCLAQVYGQTEAAVPVTFLSPEDHYQNGGIASLGRLASCGRQSPFSRVEVMDEDNNILAAREVGELCVASMGLMLGYLDDPEATASAIRGGWLHTGDLGYRDEDGYFYITDRKKDLIITGGFNVYSVEVENALLRHEHVQECAVIGIPDPKWGEAVTAVVVCTEKGVVDEQCLISFSKAAIGSMKAPKSIIFVDELPKSAIGKVLKRELRARFWSGATRNVS
jgi:acyl-CoA synthetase (AMP-forming)/AMP-acid ligase II